MHSKRLGWIFLAPSLIILFFFGVVPFLYVVFVSFHQWNPFAVDPQMIFNGADNFRRIVFDQAFLNSLGVTVLFVVFAVFSQLVLGYLLAQAFMRDFPGKAIFRTIHTLPLIMAPIIVGSVWKLMTTPSIGIIPHLLDEWFGISMNIGTSASAAFVTIVLMDIWHWTPLVTLTLIAALVSLPPDPFEQAQIDGAGKPQIFWHI
ncbi:MAG: carbohydrate ABC transporter permease, partial [Mangrovicoccus sp.]